MFIADVDNHRIRKVNANGVISTVAGSGREGFAGDGGNAADASMNFTPGIAVDEAGNSAHLRPR